MQLRLPSLQKILPSSTWDSDPGRCPCPPCTCCRRPSSWSLRFHTFILYNLSLFGRTCGNKQLWHEEILDKELYFWRWMIFDIWYMTWNDIHHEYSTFKWYSPSCTDNIRIIGIRWYLLRYLIRDDFWHKIFAMGYYRHKIFEMGWYRHKIFDMGYYQHKIFDMGYYRHKIFDMGYYRNWRYLTWDTIEIEDI